MNKTIFGTGVLFGVLAIFLGAFGAHGLRNLIDYNSIQTFEIGVKYQMYHALFLLILGGVKDIPSEGKKWVYYLITAGVILFSASIYLLALNSFSGFDFKTIGFITPIGGTLLIFGWMVLGYRVFKQFS